MRNKKYPWTIVIAVALGSAMLVACGGGEPPTPTPVPPTPTPAATPTPIATPTPSASEHMDLGMEYYEQGQLDKAIAEFQAAIELEPDDAEAHRNLGTAHLKQGRYEEAAAAYEKAIELAPDFGEAYGDLAGAYVGLGRLSEAIAAGEKAIELVPDYAGAHNNLGSAYKEQGQLEEAIAEYEEAIRLNPDDVLAHSNLGNAYSDQGQLDEAITEYQEAIRLDPDYAPAHNNLGIAYYERGKPDEAIAEWQAVTQIDPNHANAHKNLGIAYYDQGRVEEAIVEFETYLQLWPDAPDRAAVERDIAKLKESAAGQAAEYHNAAGGYSLRYPEGWYYTEDEALVTFAESEEALDAAPEKAPMVMFSAAPLSEVAESLDSEEITDPVVALGAMAENLGAEMGEVETGEVAGYPAALTSISGTSQGVSYQGGLAVVLLEERAVYGVAPAPPDQWEAFRPTFVDMLNSLSFSLPEYHNAEGGYSLLYPGGWSYNESGTTVTFAGSEEALRVPEETALKEGPLVMFDASSPAELAENFGVEDTTDPVAFVEAMAASIDAEVGGIETGQIAGYPTAYANISGVYEGAPYKGGLVTVLVEERVIGAYVMAPPDQWGAVRPIFSDMLDSLSFFEP